MYAVTRVALLAASLCTGAAQAAPFTNGSFEDTEGTYTGGGGAQVLNVGSTALPGWTVSGYQASWQPALAAYGLTSSQGIYSLDLTGAGDSAFATLSQVFDTVVGARYRLSLDLGVANPRSVNNDVCIGFDCSGPVKVGVTAGDVATEVGPYDPLGEGAQWGTFTVEFTALAALTNLSIAGRYGGGSAQYLGLDNVVVTTLSIPSPVPEPGTLSLFASGLAALACASRRRREG